MIISGAVERVIELIVVGGGGEMINALIETVP